MVCSKCGQTLPGDSEFCQYCGSAIYEKIPQVNRTSTQTISSDGNNTNQIVIKKSRRKVIVGISAAIISVVTIVILIIGLLVPWLNYSHAKKLLEAGNFELAYTAFNELGDFSNAKEMLKETQYLQAIKFRDAGDFELANDIFRSLGSYRDSKKLIHTHNYKVTERNEATCTVSGSETYTCTGCQDSYVEYLDASHKYIVSSSVEATCAATGSKTYQCTACGNQYSETITKKSHTYSAATCTEAKKCMTCGQISGSALGHSTTGTKCSRCGTTTFKTLSYSGTGSKVIDYSLPSGKFKITVTMTAGETAVDVKVHYAVSYGDTYEWFYITNAGESEVNYINGPTLGTIVINASSNYLGNSSWKVSIEAVA